MGGVVYTLFQSLSKVYDRLDHTNFIVGIFLFTVHQSHVGFRMKQAVTRVLWEADQIQCLYLSLCVLKGRTRWLYRERVSQLITSSFTRRDASWSNSSGRYSDGSRVSMSSLISFSLLQQYSQFRNSPTYPCIYGMVLHYNLRLSSSSYL